MSDAMTNDSGKPRRADPRCAGGAYGPQVHGAAYVCPRSFQPPETDRVCMEFYGGAKRVTFKLDLSSGQGSGSSHTRLQNRPRCNDRLSQEMPYRITLTVRPVRRQGLQCLGTTEPHLGNPQHQRAWRQEWLRKI